MENYEKFEQLLQQYSFKDLTEADRQLVQQFVNSEEEYESLRMADQNLASYFRKFEILPSPQTWMKIKDSRTQSLSSHQRYYWITRPMPVYATMLLLLVVGLLSWVGGSHYASFQQVSEKLSKAQIDTVFIPSKPDTVVQDRVIYVDRERQPSPAQQVSSKSAQDYTGSKGVNMKEKEELEKLLVSGSM